MKKLAPVALILILSLVLFGGCDHTYESLSYEINDGGVAITHYEDNSLVTQLTIPDEIEGVPVTTINDFGVSDTIYLTTLVIGKNVTSIANMALKNNTAIKDIVVAEGNTAFKTIDGVLYTADGTELICYPLAKTDATFTIPDGVTLIRPYAFYHCTLSSVTMSNTVEVVGNSAFLRCDSLTSVTFSSSLRVIEKDAFALNDGLTEVTLPASIQEIQTFAFYDCTSLLTINIQRPEEGMILGDRWYPTNLGRDMDELLIRWDN